jgi:LAS superfamily LD-carboxypeptidase LdcB
MKKKIALFLGLLVVQQLTGQVTLTVDSDLLLGKKEITSTTKEFTLLPQAALAFKQMQTAAKKDSVDLKVVSSFRSYATQKGIWNRKFKRFIKEGLTGPKAIKIIIEYSTLPGTSRHHWGTEVDLIDGSKKVEGDVLLEEHFHQGVYQKIHRWLQKNANRYGFEIVYTKDSLRKGFLYEPWHYSYAPLSKKFLKRYREKELIYRIKQDSTLLGKEFISPEFIECYYRENVLGINSLLKQ